MATASPVSLQTPPAPAPGTRAPASRWILNRPLDLLLFVATPLLIVPLAVAIQSPAIGADAEMFGLIVAAFGLGHHLPGLIRAYGDRELFQRFHWRFTLAPLFFVPVCIWLSYHRLNAMLLILLVWGCWHALMQVYGFARIYDGKVGSVSPVTARWDWLMCVCWFTGGQIFSSGKLARFLEYFYDSGGPLIPPAAVSAFRWAWLALCIAVTIGFLTNHVRRARGPAPHPNPVKLMMLASGIGFWWFAMVYVDQIVLGIALFEAFHDVQYLAIVWLFNCRRVNSTADLSSFMKFIFRRSGALLWLYVGLVFGYGMMSFAARSFETPGMRAALNGVILSSTILHFYYDGFIWKVRESSTRAALGLDPAVTSGNLRIRWGELGHLLKWSPLILVLGWLTVTELSGSTLPSQVEEPREWPHSTLVDRAQNIATAVPDDLRSQRRAAIGLANANRQVEAIDLLNGVLQRHPDYIEGYEILAQIYSVDNGLVAAEKTYQRALQRTDRVEELTRLHQQLGEVHYLQHRVADAEREFQQALQLDPAYEPSLAALRQIKSRQRDP